MKLLNEGSFAQPSGDQENIYRYTSTGTAEGVSYTTEETVSLCVPILLQKFISPCLVF